MEAQANNKTCWKWLRWTSILLMPESGLIPMQYGPFATGLLCLALLLLQHVDILWELQGGGEPKIAHCSPAAHQSVAFLSPARSPHPHYFSNERTTYAICSAREQLIWAQFPLLCCWMWLPLGRWKCWQSVQRLAETEAEAVIEPLWVDSPVL